MFSSKTAARVGVGVHRWMRQQTRDFCSPAAEDVAGVITGTHTAAPGQTPGPAKGRLSAREAQADTQQ